jgi:bifunctional lysine-specific demethylase and histidyl-hydroxylase NO66
VPWRPVAFTGMADVARVTAEFDDGATVVVQGLHHWWPPLAAFCRALESELGHPAQANAYWTPKSAQGLSVHHDTHDVFCLQVEGEKRWLVYDPVWELPLRNQRYNKSLGEPKSEPMLDVTLRAGDMLYLPRGWMHKAMTSAAESLHLTIGVNVYPWLEAFRAALDECADDVEFRRAADDGDVDVLIDRLRARLAPERVRERRRRKLVKTRRPILDGQFSQLRALDELDVDTELERRPTVIAELAGTRLLFDGRALEFRGELARELAFVVGTEGTFRAGDLPGDLDDEGRLVLLRRLVREGFLVVTGA